MTAATHGRAARVCKSISAISYVLLVATLISFSFIGLEPKNPAHWATLAIKVLPLMIFIPGLIQGSERSHAWLCFVVLVYFTLGILELFGLTNRLEGMLITLFSTLLFISSTLYIRWNKSEQTSPG
ncbi:MAG: DUF2069 domain-containing protein [Pseudomonadales bacterium]|nr:DUF2069 domain-containing protein [Pseudomonadales bacterium]